LPTIRKAEKLFSTPALVIFAVLLMLMILWGHFFSLALCSRSWSSLSSLSRAEESTLPAFFAPDRC